MSICVSNGCLNHVNIFKCSIFKKCMNFSPWSVPLLIKYFLDCDTSVFV